MTDKWYKRRRFMYIVSCFCVAVIIYVLLSKLDTKAAETAVSMSFCTLIGTVGSYVFGATWDDKTP